MIKRVLHLIIYSSKPEYESMLELQRSYLNRNRDFMDTFFVQFGQEDRVTDDFIYVAGKEDYLRGITAKTLRAMELMHSHNYDFVLRSNISTIVNLHAFTREFVNGLPTSGLYAGGRMHNLTSLLPWAGAWLPRFHNLCYAEGTAILWSKDVVIDMLLQKDAFCYEVVDDVAFGDWVRRFRPDCRSVSLPLAKENMFRDEMFVRHRRSEGSHEPGWLIHDRQEDVDAMRRTLAILSQNNRHGCNRHMQRY